MTADLLGVTQLVGGVVQGVAGVVDPYFYTDQEKARDAVAGQQIAAQQQAIAAQAQIAQAHEETTQKAIQYGLAGVLVVSGLFLASRLIGK